MREPDGPPAALTLQRGFTLLEMAIVMVIIGMLVAGVLRGQALLENSRVHQATRDIIGTAAAMFAYQDRYGAMPGDDGPAATLQGRGDSWSSATIGGDADGRLEANRNITFSPGGEGVTFWRQLRAAELVAGDPASTGIAALPSNAWGGLVGVTSQPVNGNMGGTKICLSQVPGSAAIALDRELDDGAGGSGRLRATKGTGGVNTAPATAVLGGGGVYSEDNVYSLCYRM